jgi:hypothetical protein
MKRRVGGGVDEQVAQQRALVGEDAPPVPGEPCDQLGIGGEQVGL